MQNVTEYYAPGNAELFIAIAYLLSLVLLSGLFLFSYRALQAKKRSLKHLKESH